MECVKEITFSHISSFNVIRGTLTFLNVEKVIGLSLNQMLGSSNH